MKSSKMLIIALALVVVILIGVIVGFVVFGREKEVKYYSYDPGDFFITNVSDSKYLLKTDIIIELTDEDTLKFLENNQFKVRDTIIDTFRAKTYDEVTSSDCIENLKKEIVNELKTRFKIKGINNIYFNEFVIQQ